MKKILLISFLVPLSMAGSAQRLADQEGYYKVHTKRLASDGITAGDNIYKKPNTTTASPNNKASYEEVVLANTYYDLQTNGSVQNRLLMDENGNMAAVWTASEDNNKVWADRGTGYSYFNGSSWTLSPDYPRIESVRCGWPNILFPSSGGEVIISHQSVVVGGTTDTKLRQNSRASRGTGSWTEKLVSNRDLTWPRAAMGGADGNSIHLIAVTDVADSSQFQGLRSALVYYRSEDAGSTYNIVDSILPGLGSAEVGPIGGDNYAIATTGDTVVIAVFDTWNDVFFLRSEDNGDTWSKTVAYNNAYAKTDIATDIVLDTADVPDGSGAILIDHSGDVHLFWSWISAFNDELEPPNEATYSFFGFREGLLYWNESKVADDLDTIAFVEDQNEDGILSLSAGFPNYGCSFTSMPSTGIAGDGTIYVSYAGIQETLDDADAEPNNYRHLYIISSTDNGASWSEPVDINPNDEFTENVFASMAREVGTQYIHLLFQRDADPGVGTTDGQPTTQNEIVYAKIDRMLNVGIEAETQSITGLSVYPNPATEIVTLNFDLNRPSLVTTSLVNVTGQKVFEAQQQVNHYNQNKFRIDVSDFPAGVYFVNIATANGKNTTEKLIIK